MTGILNALIAGVSGAVKDAYFNLVSLLLPGNGTNGAQNNTFLDGSSNNFTITRNGNTTQGTFSPFSQTGWGNYFDGSNDYLSIANNSAFNISSGDFTLETWINLNSLPSAGNTEGLVCITNTSIVNYSSVTIRIFIKSDGKIQIDAGSSSTGTSAPLFDITSVNAISLNTFTHIAFARSGSTFVLYVNGKAEATATSAATLYWDASKVFHIAADGGGTRPADGYFSNLRLVTSQALFTGSTLGTTYFTPSIQPLTTSSIGATGSGVAASLTGTVALLTCQANRFRDASSNNLTITPNNGAAIVPFSPFAPTQSYSASAVGGSGYFDGSGDYLNTASNSAFNFSATDCTIEFWYYGTPSASLALEWGTGAINDLQVYFDSSSTITFGLSNVAKTAFAFQQNAWNYFAAVKTGTTYYIYINGNRNTSYSGTAASSAQTINIGARSGGSVAMLGYLSNLRISNTARYTGTTMTVPTSQNLNDANTVLLLNFTNAGVVDATAKNVLETVGNAQISTTQSKWGGGSMYFDGTGDYLRVVNVPTLNFQSSDFTIEAWIYITTTPSGAQVIYSRETAASSGILFLINASLNVGANLSSDGNTYQLIVTGGTLSLNAWNYVCLVRSGSGTNNIKLYIAGSQVAQGTFASAIYSPSGVIPVVGARNTNGDLPFSGYIDDLRITNYARTITASPTAPFPVQ